MKRSCCFSSCRNAGFFLLALVILFFLLCGCAVVPVKPDPDKRPAVEQSRASSIRRPVNPVPGRIRIVLDRGLWPAEFPSATQKSVPEGIEVTERWQ